jgi:hypothetical protein
MFAALWVLDAFALADVPEVEESVEPVPVVVAVAVAVLDFEEDAGVGVPETAMDSEDCLLWVSVYSICHNLRYEPARSEEATVSQNI